MVIIKRTASHVEGTDISLTLLNDPSQSSRHCLSAEEHFEGTSRISLINRADNGGDVSNNGQLDIGHAPIRIS